ncbi:MAG: hypothetical protein VZQ83_02805 [Eubacterium sp.]|nr:hypothetical protein [Eubacterium sp.]
MNKRVLYHKQTGEPVQLIAQAQTKPNYQDVVCYQELTAPYEYYVMEAGAFFSTYTRAFEELPEKQREQIEKRAELPEKYREKLEKREDLPDKSSEATTEKSSEATPEKPSEAAQEDAPQNLSPMEEKMMAFLDARTYVERIRIFEDMKGASEHILANIAVSMDIPWDEKADNYERIMSELRLRKKYEVIDRRPQ